MPPMGSIEISQLQVRLPSGEILLDDVSFRVGERSHAGLVGANGTGKTTLLRVLSGDLEPTSGGFSVSGRLSYMPQMIAEPGDTSSVRDVLLRFEPPRIREAAARLSVLETKLTSGDESDALKYANGLAAWGEAGGYQAEVFWDECAQRALGADLHELSDRTIDTFSGGEQKRLVLEALFSSDAEVLLLDEPDNFLDIPGKEWLADQISRSPKSVLFISHDRALLSDATNTVITLEGRSAWTHGASFATWAQERKARQSRMEDEHKRWAEERKRLYEIMREMKRRATISDANASRAKAAETRLRHYDEAGPPPEAARDQAISVRLDGGRTGKKVVTAKQLELTDLTFPFDLDIRFGERIAVVGLNGTGKSHFLRLLDGDETVSHAGEWRLGARVVPGRFNQTNERPHLAGRELGEILWEDYSMPLGRAMSSLKRYELSDAVDRRFENLSGGQQARFQILELELSGATLLLLDEPTDNLDVVSAEALEQALDAYEGTVIAVSHDRWFLRGFDQFLAFSQSGEVIAATELDMDQLTFSNS